MEPAPAVTPAAPPRRRYVRAVVPRLRVLLGVVFAFAAALGANSAYLVGVTALEHWRGEVYQNYFYQYMFLAHLVLGLLLVVPFLAFGVAHIRNTWNRPTRRAARVGYALFAACLVLLFSGLALMRLDVFRIDHPAARA